MMQAHTYLTFNGNCREAMQFYQQCLGGDLQVQTLHDTELSHRMPDTIKDFVLQAVLTMNSFTLVATDMVQDEGLVKGNNVSLLLTFNNKREIKNCYQKLSEGGEQTHPLHHTYYGGLAGNLRDKYGNCWLLTLEAE